MKRKITMLVLTILTTLVLVSCTKSKIKTTDEVKVNNMTISYEGYAANENQTKSDYYLDRNMDYQMNIYLSNPKNYKIKDIKFKNFSYEEDEISFNEENEHIVIDKNTKNDTGKFDIEIEEIIVLINDKEYKVSDVSKGKVKLAVRARFTPVAKLDSETYGYDSHELIIEVVDRESLINYDDGDIYIEVFNEDEEIHKETLNQDFNNIELTDLLLDTYYGYKVTGTYDRYDETGENTYTMFEGNFKTKEPFNIRVLDEEEQILELEYDNPHNVDVERISLLKNGSVVKEFEDNDLIANNLIDGDDYVVEISYSYKNKGTTVNNKQSHEFTKFELVFEELIRNGRPVKHPDGSNVLLPTYRRQKEEVRGIWVSTVSNIDLAKMQGSNIEEYKDRIRLMFDNIKDANFNTIFFQIRPMNDAFYPSELAPWSRYVTGTEGKDPGFDLLEFVINEAHSRELELHGWLNPYRVASSSGMFAGMDDLNYAKKHPEYVIDDGTASILDPGIPEVQKYVRDVIMEIVENYPSINGIHFDDYFYLSSFSENSSAPDYDTYLANRENSNQSVADFRRMSVTNMIKDIFEDVEEYNDEHDKMIKFGISPSGIWANRGTHPDGSSTSGYQHYSALYADTKLWIEEGFIHYIIPQIYWEFTLNAAPYAHLVDWWSEVVKDTDVDLIIGMGLYRYRENKWPTMELAEQLRYNQTYEEVKGSTFFTYQDIIKSSPESLKTVMDHIKENYWDKEANLPWPSEFNKEG